MTTGFPRSFTACIESAGSALPAVEYRWNADTDLLVLDIDDRDAIAGVWLLNVPPFPGDQ